MDLASCRLPVAAGLLVLAVALVLTSDGAASGLGVIERVGPGGEGSVAITDDGRFVAFDLQV